MRERPLQPVSSPDASVVHRKCTLSVKLRFSSMKKKKKNHMFHLLLRLVLDLLTMRTSASRTLSQSDNCVDEKVHLSLSFPLTTTPAPGRPCDCQDRMLDLFVALTEF